MALLNLNRYFESFQNVEGRITGVFSLLKRKFSDGIVDVILLIIFAIVAIIIGIVLAIPYAFFLGEENILDWGLSHSFPVLVLTAISVFGCAVSLGVVKAMGGWFRMILAISFWVLTLFGPIIWTHLVKLFGAPGMIQYRKLTIFFPVVFLVVSILIYAFIDDARDKKRNRESKKLEKELQKT